MTQSKSKFNFSIRMISLSFLLLVATSASAEDSFETDHGYREPAVLDSSIVIDDQNIVDDSYVMSLPNSDELALPAPDYNAAQTTQVEQ